MKIKTFAVTGIFFILLGVASLIHPRLLMPAKTDVSTAADHQRVIVETRRIVQVPRVVGIVWIIAGCGLAYLSTTDPPKSIR